MFRFIVTVFFIVWIVFDFFAMKKDVDQNIGQKKVVLDFFLAFPIAIVKAVKRLVSKKPAAK